MNLGNIIGQGMRWTVATVTDYGKATGQFIDTQSGEAFSNPRELIKDLAAGAQYALSNKVYETVASASIILGTGIAGLALAKKAYSLPKAGYTYKTVNGKNAWEKDQFGNRIKDACGSLDRGEHRSAQRKRIIGAVALLAFAAFQLYANVTELRLTGKCVNLAQSLEPNTWDISYANLGCEALTGTLSSNPLIGS